MTMFHADSMLIGLVTLRRNPMRTILSTLGVIIGVAALVAVLSLGDSLEAFSRRQIEETTDLQSVSISPRTLDRVGGVAVPRKKVQRFTVDDIRDLGTALGDLASVTLTLTGSSWIALDTTREERAVLVIATIPDALEASAAGMATGRFLDWQDFDADAPIAVLSGRAAEMLAPGGDVDGLVGRRLASGDTIVGILDDPSTKTPPSIYVPLDERARTRLSRPDRAAVALIRARRIEDVSRIVSTSENWLSQRFAGAENQFTVSSSRQRVVQATQVMRVFKLALGSIAGISLLVGGIGIMNILLASVTERTKEIGIRRATGARRGHIVLQFLSESILISVVGSLIGAVLGIGATYVIMLVIELSTEAPVSAVFSTGSLVFAALAAIVIGLLFGTYPARRAAGIEPAVAMRHE